MDFHVTLEGRGDLAARIYHELRAAILDGRMRPGERLPPSREFARRLDVSRNTVAAAYERLTAEGFLVSRVGSGTYVCAESVGRVRSRSQSRSPLRSRPQSRSRGAAPGARGVVPRPLWHSLGPAQPPEAVLRFDFRVGVPDGRLFPIDTWRRLVARELRDTALRTAGYDDPSGHPGLRAAIARHLGLSRAVRALADDVLITQGAQQALDLIGRILVEPGACVAVEEPGYQPARRLFAALGARVVGVPVDAEGLDVAALPRGARLVYTTPSHQFPLGSPMSLRRRTALLAWAARHGAAVIEDDYDSEFRFADRPLEPLQSLDRDGRVLYVGSFSKTMLPALRLGYVVAPASLQPALRTAKQLSDWHGDPVTQGALAAFIDDGLLARHVRRAARGYAARRELILATLARDFAAWLDVVPSVAGLHVSARVRPGVSGVDVDRVRARARDSGVGVQTLASCCGDAPQPGLMIGYGAILLDAIAPGLRRLADCFQP